MTDLTHVPGSRDSDAASSLLSAVELRVVWAREALSSDGYSAMERLHDAIELSLQARSEPCASPFASWSDLLSPPAWTLQVARTQLSLARFYLGLAIRKPSEARVTEDRVLDEECYERVDDEHPDEPWHPTGDESNG